MQFVFDFVLGEYFELEYQVVEEIQPVQLDNIYLNYSNSQVPGYYSVFRDELLLSEKIEKQQLFISRENDMPVFFQTTDHYDLKFDIFSAIFYLLTRYEEYLPHEKDVHGRYRSSNSILSNDAFQFTPVVETWLQFLKEELLKLQPGLEFKKYEFEYEPTFDIDNAFAYRGRRWPKILGPLAKPKAWKFIFSDQPDPYDTAEDILFYLERYQLRARFFFLMNDHGKFNSTVSPNSSSLHDRIKRYTTQHGFGIHPSYRAYEDDLLSAEIDLLEEVVGIPAEHSRQHFLRINLPDYYRWLLAHGIKNDHSLGYPEVSGFRAGISRPFLFFDLMNNRPTDLRIHPFAFMDATYIYYQKSDIKLIIKKILQIKQQVSKVNGKLVTISHNDLLEISNQVNFWSVFENCAV